MADESMKLLESYQNVMKKIRKAKHLKDAAFERATACGNVTDGSSHGSVTPDKVGNGVISMEKWSEIIHELNLEAESIQNEILRIAARLDESLADIIVMHYINSYSLRTMAEELNYSERHIRRLLKKAIEDFSTAYFCKKSEMSANAVLQ